MIFGEEAVTDRDHEAHAVALRGLGESAHFDANRIRLVPGDPAIALAAVAREQRYDVLVLGALTHQPRVRKLVGSLTRKLMETLDSDFVLVRPNGSGFAAQGVGAGRTRTVTRDAN
jgi:nucleotide-binding universal stress UspA family protein